MQHLEYPGLVHLETLCLEFEPLLELRDPLKFPVLLVEQTAELLFVFAGLAQVPLVVAPGAAVPDATPQEPERH